MELSVGKWTDKVYTHKSYEEVTPPDTMTIRYISQIPQSAIFSRQLSNFVILSTKHIQKISDKRVENK